MKATAWIKILISASIGFVVLGCGTQQTIPEDVELSSNVAVLHTPSNFAVWGDNPAIFRIDGELPRTANVVEMQIVPGVHTVRFRCTRRFSTIFTPMTISGPIEFSAEAAQQYRAYCDVTDEKTFFWIEDIATGDVVGGEKP
jgi:hypothetical protein